MIRIYTHLVTNYLLHQIQWKLIRQYYLVSVDGKLQIEDAQINLQSLALNQVNCQNKGIPTGRVPVLFYFIFLVACVGPTPLSATTYFVTYL